MQKTEHGRRFVADYLKIPELARRLDVSEKTVRRYVKAGALPSTFIGGAYRVTEEDLKDFVRRAEVTPEEASPKGSGRSSPEPSLFSELEDERRRTFVQSCRRYAESRAEKYEVSVGTLTQEGGVFAGPEGARILFVEAYEEYVELRPLVGRDLAFLFDEGLSEYEASRFSSLAVATLRPLAETVERLGDRAAELAKTEAQKAEVERRREEMRRSA
jgi:excisionase family DNA binding protein